MCVLCHLIWSLWSFECVMVAGALKSYWQRAWCRDEWMWYL